MAFRTFGVGEDGVQVMREEVSLAVLGGAAMA